MLFNGHVKYFALQSWIYKGFESWVASAVVKKLTSIKLLTMEANMQLKAQLVISLGRAVRIVIARVIYSCCPLNVYTCMNLVSNLLEEL